MSDSELNSNTIRLAGIGAAVIVALIIGLIVLGATVTTVDEGVRGVEKTQGAVTGNVLDPGWHVLIPFYQSVEFVKIRPQTYTMSGNVHEGDVKAEDAVSFRSQDQQEVGSDITVRYTVDKQKADAFHTEYDDVKQFEKRLLRPETIDTVAREGSAFNATEANSDQGRQQIKEVVERVLQDESPDYVSIESVQVRDMYFSKPYQAALEDVEVAQQEAAAKRTRAQGDADAARIRAEGEADALEEVQSELEEENLALRQIQAYDDGTVYVTDGNTPVILRPENNGTTANAGG